MDVYSKGFQDVTAIRLELLRKNEIQLSTNYANKNLLWI